MESVNAVAGRRQGPASSLFGFVEFVRELARFFAAQNPGERFRLVEATLAL